MRVLFAAFPTAEHLRAAVPLAWALRNAGHQVRFATHPDLAAEVAGAGLAAVPVGRGVDLADLVDLARNPALAGHPGGGLAVGSTACPDWGARWFRTTRVMAGLRPLLEELTGAAVRWRPDLVVRDPLCLPAAVAARLSGAAHARLLGGRDNVAWLRQRSRRYLAADPAAERHDPLEEVMQQLLEPYGLPYEEELLVGQWTVDPLPPGLRLPAAEVRYQSMRWIPYGGGGSVPDRLHARPGRPRVCVAWTDRRLPLPEVLAALAELDVEPVVADTGPPAAAPLDQLLPGCAAVLHHGGSAVFAAAAAHGVPQLIVPAETWDEGAVARYAARRGAGRTLAPELLTPAALGAELRTLLADPRHRVGAAALGSEVAALPGPADLVPVLVELTRRHQRI